MTVDYATADGTATAGDDYISTDEGAVLGFAVTLSRAASGLLTIDYGTTDGSAQASVDYTVRERDALLPGGRVVEDD